MSLVFTQELNFQLWPLTDMLILIILPLLIMIFGGIIIYGFMEGFMEGLEKLIASISNTISYARILALNMAHAGFAKTFLFLGGVTITTIGGVLAQLANGTLSPIMLAIMLLVGTIFVLLMEGLLSFIHSLRLHWVEAYLKFYAGTGYKFEPLKMPSDWTTVSVKTK